MNFEQIAEEYKSIINKYTKTIPVDVVGLANAVNIDVYKTKFENQKISGYISKDESGYFICVNDDHAATRQQFTIAHELGHYFLHKHLLDKNQMLPTFYKNGTGIENNAILRSEYDISADYKRIEKEANSFAANLLMPQEQFIKEANLCDDLTELANKFKVSVGAASIRANNLGIEIF